MRSPTAGFRLLALAVATVLAAALLTGLPSTAAPPGGPTPAAAAKRKLDTELSRTLATSGEADFVISFGAAADLRAARKTTDWTSRGTQVLKSLDATAESTQRSVRTLLDAAGVSYRSFSVANAIYVFKGSATLATNLSARQEVSRLDAARTFALPKPTKATAEATVDGVEWGVAQIHADQVWSDFHSRGEGIVVASIDSGVQYDHPALIASYRGNRGDGTFEHDYNWYDPSQVCARDRGPCDNSGHGTHTMGTMVGDAGAGNKIGVAPGARWITAKGCETAESCSTFALLASAQWILAPTDQAGHNPRPDLRPQIVNNSWGAGNGPDEDPWYDASIASWVAAGIFPTFSVGNDGEFGCDTAGTPGDSAGAYSVGAYDSDGMIGWFSSRGPGADDEVKPNISAPGVAVRSSLPGNSYGVYNGTSMAAPHVSAAVALLWSAAPSLIGDVQATRALLDETAVDVDDTTCGGTAEDNNTYGEGRLDAHRLIELAPHGPSGTLTGRVSTTAGEPIGGANITISGPAHRTVSTAPDGTFTARLPVGDYDLTADGFGYNSSKAVATVAAGGSTSQDFTLTAIPRFAISGTVSEGSAHRWPLYARIVVDGVPDGTYFTDPVTGKYRIELPTGTTYKLRVRSEYPGLASSTATIAVDGQDVVHDTRLAADAYDCTAPGYRAAADRVVTGQTFDDPTTPAGWTVTDPLSNGQVWRFDDDWGFGNRTGGEGLYAWVFSDGYGADAKQDTALVSPPIDLSDTATPAVWFRTNYSDGPHAVAAVDVSVDGGTTWTTEWSQTRPSIDETRIQVPIPSAAGKANVRVRFHYTASFSGWWMIDDVAVGERVCDTVTGSLVAGQVRDANTGTPLNDATVRLADGSATTRATPVDRGQDDGFYWMFTPATGPQEVTAAYARYATAARSADLSPDTVNRVDLAPTAGIVSVDKTELSAATVLGGKTTAKVTLRNTGTAPTTVTLAERKGDSQAAAATQGAPLQRIKGTFSPGPSPVRGATRQAPATASTPVGGPWTSLADYPVPIMDNAVAAYQGDLYSVGGRTSVGATADAYTYDSGSGTWSRIAELPRARQKPAAAFLDGKLYVAGGWGSTGQARADMDVYDPATNKWTAGPGMPAQRTAAGTAVLGDQLYVVGGCHTSCTKSEVYRYDASARTWTQVANYPRATAWLACGGIDNAVYCAGGTSETGESTRTYRYDPAGNTWTRLADLPFDLWGMASAVADGRLLVSGGATAASTAVTNQGLAYDPGTDQWTELPNSQQAFYRSGSACGFAKVGGTAGSFVPSPVSEILPGYADCGDQDPVGWLRAAPVTVTLEPGQQSDVTVSFDTTALTQPGDYTAAIESRDTTPYTAVQVGVALTVSPPQGWGQLTGTVTAADCGSAAAPLPGATIRIDGRVADHTVRSDLQGRYALWLDERNSPLTLTVVRDGWFPQTAKATVRAGQTTTNDFTLTRTGCSSTRRTS